mgnify:CR=1 FL=1
MAYVSKPRKNVLHIEADGCIVNVYEKLHDRFGRDVTVVEILPDDETRGGDWKLYGYMNNRVVKLKKKQK